VGRVLGGEKHEAVAAAPRLGAVIPHVVEHGVEREAGFVARVPVRRLSGPYASRGYGLGGAPVPTCASLLPALRLAR
jgi:hypothetical protein